MNKIISCQATELQNTAALTQEDWIEMGNEVLADLRDYYKTPAGKRQAPLGPLEREDDQLRRRLQRHGHHPS